LKIFYNYLMHLGKSEDVSFSHEGKLCYSIGLDSEGGERNAVLEFTKMLNLDFRHLPIQVMKR
jgi:hypothetical protein